MATLIHEYQTSMQDQGEAGAYEKPPCAKHTHLVGALGNKSGLLDFFRSLMNPTTQKPEVILAINTEDLLKLSFQPAAEHEFVGVFDKIRSEEEDVHPSKDNMPQIKDRAHSPAAYAVKAPKPGRRRSSTTSQTRRRSSASISSSLTSLHVLHRFDIVTDGIVGIPNAMSGFSGIHLGTVIVQAKKMGSEEADCYFKQLVRGTAYLHSVGIAHRDLRPENLLITSTGVLKIANFSNSECFMDNSKGKEKVKMSSKRCGSGQYMAPEVFVDTSFDPRATDMWAIGLIYIEMRTGRLFWELAAEAADEFYDRYLLERMSFWGFRPIQNLSNEYCRRVINSLLDPCSDNRLTCLRVLKSIWCVEIELCEAAMSGRLVQG